MLPILKVIFELNAFLVILRGIYNEYVIVGLNYIMFHPLRTLPNVDKLVDTCCLEKYGKVVCPMKRVTVLGQLSMIETL